MACDSGSPKSTTAVRDSAGVTIVDASDSPLEPLWDLSAIDPVVGIGAPESGTTLFRVTGGGVLSDGRIAIAEASTGLVRIFTASGEPLSEFGGLGEGPEEFGALTGLEVLPGDTLLLWDPRAQRLTYATPDGAFVGSFRFPFERGVRSPRLFRLTSGSVIAATISNPGAPEPATRPGIERRDEAVVLAPADGSHLDTLGMYPGAEFMIREVAGRTLFGAAPFPRDLSLEVLDDRVLLGPAERPEFLVLDTLGNLETIVRFPNVRRAVSSEDRSAVEDGFRAQARSDTERQMVAPFLEALVYPDSIQPYNDIEVGRGGETFVRVGPQYLPLITASDWLVFNGAWALTGLLKLPDGFEPLEFGEDYVLGVQTDDMGVETVELLRR